jgi:hypothetical protein
MKQTWVGVRTEKQDRQCTYKRNIEARSRNHCCPGIVIYIKYSECVCVVLVIQQAKRMRSLYCHVWQLINGSIFRGGGGETSY